MMTYLATLYILIPVFSFYYGNATVGFSVLVFEIISLFFIPLIIKYKQEKIRNVIKNSDIGEPILNINKAPWYLLSQLPDVSEFEAKKIIHLRRKYGKYKSLDEFFKVNQFPSGVREKIEKYLYV